MAKRKRAPVAQPWQLDILRHAHDKSQITEEKRAQLAAETGLTQEWIKKWWNRQGVSRSPAQSPRVPPRQFSTSPAIRPSSTKSAPRPAAMDRSRATLPNPPPAFCTPSPIISSSFDLCQFSSQAHPSDNKDSHDPLHISDDCALSLFGDPYPSPWPNAESSININRWSYSRNPLHDRYPDFSQFFLPKTSPNKYSASLSPSSPSPLYLDPQVQLAWLNPAILDIMKAQALPVSWVIRRSDVAVLGQILYETAVSPPPSLEKADVLPQTQPRTQVQA